MPSTTPPSDDSDNSNTCERDTPHLSNKKGPLPIDEDKPTKTIVKDVDLALSTTIATPAAQITQKPLVTPSTASSSTEARGRQLDFLSPAQEKNNERTQTLQLTSVTPGILTDEKKLGKRKQRKQMPNLFQFFQNDTHLEMTPHVSLNLKSLPEVLQPVSSIKETSGSLQCSMGDKIEPSEEDEIVTDEKRKRRKI